MDWEIFKSNQSESELIRHKIIDFNRGQVPFTQQEDFVDLNFNLKDTTGSVIAGINALMYCWGVVYVNFLAVDKEYRGQNLGSLLLGKVETEARSHSASLIHLDTYDWQAKDFYLKLGYELFGTLDGCPPGHNRYFLKKYLNYN